jgi:hypothetical protein
MKFDKWTLGLAALGVVSLSSAARAEEKMTALQSALSATTISGYVDTSAQWNIGKQASGGDPGYFPVYSFGGADKADGFNLNVVQLTIAKALDEAEWASGYRVDLWFGPDANRLASASTFHTASYELYPDDGASADLAIRQAYVALRAPLGNGLDVKIGVFDSPLGYESLESGNNPNYTRSYGHSIEPTTLTGVMASYRFNDMIALSAGIANTKGPHINARAHGEDYMSEANKTYFGTVAFTAPESWGWASGSTLYGGVMHGMDDNEAGYDYDWKSTSWYLGGTLATPVAGLKLGAAFDLLDFYDWGSGGTVWTIAGYASYQATEKLSIHARAEYVDDNTEDYVIPNYQGRDHTKIFALTGTVQYDLWENVISRLEIRWDHSMSGKIFGKNAYNGEYYGPDQRDAVMIAANVIYKF